MNKLFGASVAADYAVSQIDPGIRMGDSTVMLSAAKHRVAERDRPFASLSMTSGGRGSQGDKRERYRLASAQQSRRILSC